MLFNHLKDNKSFVVAVKVVLFLLLVFSVFKFGILLFGGLVLVALAGYICLKHPFYALLLTIVTMFFPANIEEAMGLSIIITPTRLAGMLLVFSLLLNYRNFDWGRLGRGNGVFIAGFILILWGLITLIINTTIPVSFYLTEALPSLILMAAVILILDKNERVDIFIITVVLAVIITAISALVQSGINMETRAAGLALNPNKLAFNCILGIGLGTYLWKKSRKILLKLFWLAVVMLLSVTVAYTASRSGMLGFGAMVCILLIWSLKNKQANLWVLLGFGALAVILYAPQIFWERMGNIPLLNRNIISSSAAEIGVRQWMYARGWQLFMECPIYGWGAYSFMVTNGSLVNWAMHSWYLAMLCEQGLVGLAIYLYLFFSVGKNLYISSRNPHDTVLKDKAVFLIFTAIGLSVMGIFATTPLYKVVFIVAGLSSVIYELSNR